MKQLAAIRLTAAKWLDAVPPEPAVVASFLVIAWALGTAAPDAGADVSTQFYSAVASIVPIVLLALLVEVRDVAPIRLLAARLDRIDDRLEAERERVATAEQQSGGLPDLALRASLAGRLEIEPEHAANRAWLEDMSKSVRGSLRASITAAITAEAAALYALGADHSSTFLLSLAVLPLAMLGFLLFWLWDRRFAPR